MNEDTDTTLARLFAERAEDLDGSAFAADVSRRMARARLFGRLSVVAMALALSAAAVALAPLLTHVTDSLATASVLLTAAKTYLGAIPFAWLGAGAVALLAAMWVRL